MDSSSVNKLTDSLLIASDTSLIDSLPQTKYPISPDAIDQLVEYGARDTIVMDNLKRLVHLYGEAYVNYGELSLVAEYILLDLNTNIAMAEGVTDSMGNIYGTPVFKDGAQEIEAGRMRYNFKKRKGLVYEVTTTESDLYVRGATTKFYGSGSKETGPDHTIYNRNAIFTTCDHEVPHFGIRSRKQKVVPDKVAVVGASNLEISGVPTPLYLPFGFFPLKVGKRGGLIFPNNYQYSPQWGYGLENVGYYFPLSDYMDFTVLTDFFFRGSYGIDGQLRYKKRYKYNGEISVGYSSFKQEVEVFDEVNNIRRLIDQRDNSYFIRVRHNQDAQSNPYTTLGGSINIDGGQYDNLNFNDANRVLNNTLNSNFSLSQIFPGTPFTASLSIRHSQNTATRAMDMSLPRLDIRMKQINPFKQRRRVGDEKWFERVTLGYSSKLQYDLRGVDSTFFQQETFDNARFGFQHNISTNVNFNVFKYFQLSPFANLRETWYTKETRRFFIDDLEIVSDTTFNPEDPNDFIVEFDTLSYGIDTAVRISNFNAIHEYNTGISLFTKIYGTMRFKKGKIRGIRHTLKPTISMSYSPDYTRESLGYFDEYVTIGNDGVADTITYSVFQGENLGSPSGGGERFSLNYSLLNLFEAKIFDKRDSTFRKTNILDNLNISGNYNFAADSLNWSPISFSGNVRFLKGKATLKLQGAFDPYTLDENGRRINTFEREASGKLLRFDNARLSFNTGMSIGELRGLFKPEVVTGSKKDKKPAPSLGNFFDNLRLTYQFTIRSRRRSDNSIFFEPSVHSVALRGDIPLSPKWKLNIGNIDYNFITKSTSYPDLGLSRDLHCWTMGISWQPERSTYNFYIRVKPGSLDFINVPYNRNRVDGFNN